MSDTIRRCASCGQFMGVGHSCPPPTAPAPIPATPSQPHLPDAAAQPPRPQVASRVAAARQAITTTETRPTTPAPDAETPARVFTPPANAEEARGRTLYMVERNGYDDSDFTGLFYDPEHDTFGMATTGSTAYGGGFIPNPDASEEIVAKYAARYAEARAKLEARVAAYEAAIPNEGKTVTIAGGRKHQGKTGQVIWYGKDKFAENKFGAPMRVKVRTEDGEEFYVPATYTRVYVNGEYVEPNDTYLSTGLSGGVGGSLVNSMHLGFAIGHPSPEQVEAACRRGRQRSASA